MACILGHKTHEIHTESHISYPPRSYLNREMLGDEKDKSKQQNFFTIKSFKELGDHIIEAWAKPLKEKRFKCGVGRRANVDLPPLYTLRPALHPGPT